MPLSTLFSGAWRSNGQWPNPVFRAVLCEGIGQGLACLTMSKGAATLSTVTCWEQGAS